MLFVVCLAVGCGATSVNELLTRQSATMSKRLLIVFLLLQIVIIVLAVLGLFQLAAIVSPLSTAAGFVALYKRMEETGL